MIYLSSLKAMDVVFSFFVLSNDVTVKFLHMALVPVCTSILPHRTNGSWGVCFQPYKVSIVFKIRFVVIVLTFTFTGSL